MVFVRTKKGRYGLTKNEFQKYMRTLWERAQTRKMVREEIEKENKENKENKGG